MKKSLTSLLGLGIILLSCSGASKPETLSHQEAENADNAVAAAATETQAVTETPVKVTMSGTIDPKKWTPGKEVTVTFSHFPTTVEGFKQVQQEIGGTPQGAAVLQLIAFEMYNQNTAVGTKCVELNNTQTNVPSVMRRLPEIFGKNSLDSSYPRKHIVATFLAGATPENGFNPKRPYTVKIRSSKVHDYQRSEMLKGYVIYLDVYSTGYDTSWRGCEVVKQKGNEYYTVSNSPSMYVQCKDVPFDSDEDYKGLK